MPRLIRVGCVVQRHVHVSTCMGLLGGARSRSIGTEGAEALPRWDPPASCPRWLSNTTYGAPSSRRARGMARMRVPSSSLTLRSGALVRTRRGSSFEPLISRAVRGGAWASPSLRMRPLRGPGEPALEVPISNSGAGRRLSAPGLASATIQEPGRDSPRGADQ
jgi:hypothetical protein